jgi:transcriptional regulator with XRE-family HTH domain
MKMMMSTSLRNKSIKAVPATVNPIGQRLRLEMKKRGVASAELAKKAGVKTSFIYDVVSGKSANPSTVKLARVAGALGVDLMYLVGSDALFHSDNDYVTVPHIMVDVSDGKLVSVEQEDERYHFRSSWIKGQLGGKPSDMRLLHVRGDSMEDTLSHNDTILIDIAKKTPSPPGIFVLFDGVGLVAKRLEYIDGNTRRLRIISDNPHYSTYERSSADTLIIGRIVWFAREI